MMTNTSTFYRRALFQLGPDPRLLSTVPNFYDHVQDSPEQATERHVEYDAFYRFPSFHWQLGPRVCDLQPPLLGDGQGGYLTLIIVIGSSRH